MAQDDDEAWRSIVDNYGDRPQLEDPTAPDDGAGRTGRPVEADEPSDRDDAVHDAIHEPGWDDDRFVPPPPPPVPTTTADRTAAWLGIFGAPAVLLVTLVLGIRLPELINYLLVIGFVGGFLYLVLKMNREPRDPDDNGAVL